MKALVITLAGCFLCVYLALELVTARQMGTAQARRIAVLEEQVNALYLAARWDVPAPGTDGGDGAAVAAVPVIRPKAGKQQAIQ